MKYQVGDRVKIKSFDWFRNGACIGFRTLMSKYCGEVLTIQSINNTNTYCMKEDGGQFFWSDDMIEGVMNISKLGAAANPIEPKSNANCLTRERVDEHFVEVKELKVENCFLEWRMTDNCLACKHFVALVKSKDGKWKVLCETNSPTIE